jgi:hypothetical protein
VAHFVHSFEIALITLTDRSVLDGYGGRGADIVFALAVAEDIWS